VAWLVLRTLEPSRRQSIGFGKYLRMLVIVTE
jgi:hypothetical protein